MKISEAIILGLVQGLTEFLPVSSSGHLSLFEAILGVEGDPLFFGLFVHLGTLVAVCCVFFKDILRLFKRPYKNLLMLMVATIPAGIVGVLLDDLIGSTFSSTDILCYTFLGSAVLLWVSQVISGRKSLSPRITYPTAIAMGVGQAFAILPGLSRSGTTIAVGLMGGKSRDEVAKFSFLMSIPVILGGVVIELIQIVASLSNGATVTTLGIDILPTVIASIFAGISGYVAIRWMLSLIKRCDLRWFSAYLFVLSLVVFVNSYVVCMW